MWLSRLGKNETTVYSTVGTETGRPSTDDVNKPDTPSLAIAKWPVGARRIARAPWWLLIDFLLLLVPATFLGKCILYDTIK
jgi:hypothetical protein